MNVWSWFDEIPVVGNLPMKEAISKLREVGEYEAADQLEIAEKHPVRAARSGQTLWPFHNKPWQHTTHVVGYISPRAQNNDPQPITHVETIEPDLSLRGARVKITLNRLRIAEYPGRGIHHVLLHFGVQNQAGDRTEPVHFNATYRVQQGESAGIQGYPIVVGFCVAHEGLILRCRTINVRNEQDEAFLRFMESDTFKMGLQIISTAQPVIRPFSEMALGLAQAIAARHRNISVQDLSLGLGFSPTPLAGCLAEGAYLAAQVPESSWSAWDWEEWVYLPSKGRVVKRSDPQQLIPYNYLVFGVSRCSEQYPVK